MVNMRLIAMLKVPQSSLLGQEWSSGSLAALMSETCQFCDLGLVMLITADSLALAGAASDGNRGRRRIAGLRNDDAPRDWRPW